MSTKEFIKRYILFMIGLFFSAFGVSVIKHSDLGVAPVSAIANVIFHRFPDISLGTWLIIWNMLLLLLQIILLRKDFRIYNLLQIPLSIAFGIFTDFGLWCISTVEINGNILKIITLFAGIFIRSFGIALSLIADIILNSGEAFVKALSDVTKYKFGFLKIMFDVGCVLITVIISLSLFDMKIIGIGIGTVVSSVFTGMFISMFLRLIQKPVNKFLCP